MNFAVIRNGRLLATTTPAEAKATIADTMFEGVVGRHDLDAFAATFQVAQAYLVEGVHRVRVYSPDREVPTHFSDIDAPVRAVANSVYALSPTFAMSGVFVYPFFAALMAGLSVMRDDEAGLSELLQSTPLTRAEYVWAKCAGVSCAMMIAMLAPHPRQLSALRPTMTRPPVCPHHFRPLRREL